MNNESDFVYITLDQSYTSTGLPQIAQSELQSNYPYIKNPNDYYLNISRLYIESLSFPLLSVKPIVGQNDVNKLYYQFAMGYNGIFSDPINVEFIQQNNLIQVPSSPVTLQTASSAYYDIYFYAPFLDMMNNCMTSCLQNLNDKVDTGETTPPRFYYNGGVIVLNAPKIFGQNNSITPQADTIQIYFNSYVKPLVQGIPSLLISNITGCNNCFLLYDTINNTLNDNWNVSMQGSSCCSNYGPRSIVITTTMPIINEYTPQRETPQLISSQIAVLTDLLLDTSIPSSYSGLQIYNASNTLRMTQMNSYSPMYSINASIWYKTAYGDLKQLYLTPGSSFSIKFEFIKKNVYSPNK